MLNLHFKQLIQVSFFLLGTLFLQAEENTTTSSAIRIMPLGDSITYDTRRSDQQDPRPSSTRTGYRSHLWYMLKKANYQANFVGSRVAGQAINPPFDPDNEGHPNWTSLDIFERTYSYMTKSQPNIVLLHIGTNDHSTYAGDVGLILNEINHYEQTSGQNVHVYVALIINRQEHDPVIKKFNSNLKKIIAAHVISGDKITLVNMYHDAGLTHTDYADNTHPNNSGYYKMATVWFNALMKPYNPSLARFPYSLAPADYIESININETATNVIVTTYVPDTGILF